MIFQFTGDPAVAMAGRTANQAQIDLVRQTLGLDKPLYVQYGVFLWNAVHGDFGISYQKRAPALPLILERFPATFELAVISLLIGVCSGLTFGIIAAIRPKALYSRIIMAGSLVSLSIPVFLFALLMILIFAVWLRIMPPFGRGAVVTIGSWRSGLLTLDGWKHIVMPALTLGLFQIAVLVRLVSSGMRDILEEDFIRTARSKGVSERVTVINHALRNVLIPVITIIGLQFGDLIAFSLVTETIFQWPGMGNLLLTSIYETDQPIIVAYLTMVAMMIVLISIAIDLIYGMLDPRIRYE